MNKKSIYIHYFKGYSARNMHISWFLLQFHLSNFDKEIRIRLCYHDLAGGKEKRKNRSYGSSGRHQDSPQNNSTY